jgi:hypothetical protein
MLFSTAICFQPENARRIALYRSLLRLFPWAELHLQTPCRVGSDTAIYLWLLCQSDQKLYYVQLRFLPVVRLAGNKQDRHSDYSRSTQRSLKAGQCSFSPTENDKNYGTFYAVLCRGGCSIVCTWSWTVMLFQLTYIWNVSIVKHKEHNV